MRHASTIAIARTLLARGRPDDVVRMLEPLANEDARDAADVVLHALLSRVHLLVHADPDRAQRHLEMASRWNGRAREVPEFRLWRGWLRAWPHRDFHQPELALAELQAAHAASIRSHDIASSSWALLGGAVLYVSLDEPHLARHLAEATADTAWSRHDSDLRFWLSGVCAVLALQFDQSELARERISEAESIAERIDSPLYRGRIRALCCRSLVAEGASVADVDAASAEALELLRNGARSFCPAAAEVFLSRIDTRMSHRRFDEASSLLSDAPTEFRELVSFDQRLDARRKQIERQEPRRSYFRDERPFARYWPDGSTFGLPYWQTLPPLTGSSASFLITGERGTGKKYLAAQMHLASGLTGEFVVFDCATPSPGDLNLLLLGGDGSTGLLGEAADGTMLLREIHRMPLDTQRRLARVLREDGIDARVIASTDHTLDQLISDASFSNDLLSEIGRITINLPPLRDRRSHIPLLVADLIEKLRPRDLPLASMTEDARRAIVAYDWPGNIRQLQNELERMLTLVSNEPAPVIHLHDLPDHVLERASEPRGGDGAPSSSLDDVVAQAERAHIVRILTRNAGQVSASAEDLGLTRQGLYKKMKRLGIEPAEFQRHTALPAEN